MSRRSLTPRPDAPPDLARLERTTGFLLRLAQLRVYEAFHARLAPLGITPTRYSVLCVVADNPGIRPHEIAAALRVKRPNLATLQAQLEREGLLARMAEAGGRAVRLRLTPQGARLLARLARIVQALDRELTAPLSPQEHATLLSLLHRLVQA